MDMNYFTMRLRAVTPLHFGSGNTYIRDFDYIGKSFINVNGIMHHLKRKPQLLHAMATAIEGNKLKDFIIQNRKEIPETFFKPMNVDEEPQGDIRAHIKNGFGGAYIPGSAIKGSLRTSIIKAMSTPAQLENFIKETLSDSKFFVKFADSMITNSLLSSHPRGDAKFNLMKALRISDSETIPGDLQVKTIQIKNTSKGPLYVEVIPSETNISFAMNLDAFFLSQGNYEKLFGKIMYDFNSLLADLNEATVKTLSYHKRYSEKNDLHAYDFLIDVMKSLKGNEALLNLGYGIGWVGMTGNLIGSYYNKLGTKDKIQLKNTLRLNQQNNGKHLWDYYPITRRFIIENGREIPMGWAVLTFPDNYMKKRWEFNGIPECTDYLDDIKGDMKGGVSVSTHVSGGGLAVGQICKSTIVSINKERKFAEATVGKIKGRIRISEITNAFVKDMRDYIWEGKEVNVKVVEINNGKYFFSIKQAD